MTATPPTDDPTPPAPPAAPDTSSVWWSRARFITGLSATVAAGIWIILGNPTDPWMYLPQTVLLGTVAYLIAVGAQWLVDAACRIAQRWGVSYLIIGLTVVAMGTSAPELAASLLAGMQGRGDITVANVIGSNIFNLCFILGGVATIVGGLRVDRALLVRDGPLLLLVTLLLFLFVGSAAPVPVFGQGIGGLLDLKLGRIEGAVLLGTLIVYLYSLYRVLQRSTRSTKAAVAASADSSALVEPPSALLEELNELPTPDEIARSSTPRDLVWLMIGLVLVVGGSHVLVGSSELIGEVVHGFGALWFAAQWGVPDYIVGVTIIAAGTSAPEFVVSLVAALRGAFGMSAGNLIGSDLFNMLGVLGICGLVLQPPLAAPVTLSAAVVPSLLALTGLVALTLVFMWTGRRISRLEGIALLAIGALRWAMDFSFRGAF